MVDFAVDEWTQDSVWYNFLPTMEKYGIKVTRQYVKRLIRVICEELGVTREQIGIIAAPRATMYFDGQWSSVSFDSVDGLAENGTHIIFIEKMDIVRVLAKYADKYGVALVNSQGHLTEYGKDLIEAARKSGAHIAILTDYDASGIKIASEVPEQIPRLGVDDEMLNYFGLPRDDKQISVSYNPLKQEIDPIKRLIEYGKDERFRDIDIEFLKHKRVEIDAVLAAVGSERLWEYIMYKLTELFPTRNYNRVISTSPILSQHYPKAILNFNNYIANHVKSLVAKEQQKIEMELENVVSFINVEDKRVEIDRRLGKIVENDPNLKKIASKLEEVSAWLLVSSSEETSMTDNNNIDDGSHK
jgi:5S rRNA maturation endonuclease (ribonuclease M5)